MKISAVSNNVYKTRNNNKNNAQTPSFEAKVNLLLSHRDSVSGTYVELTKEPLKQLSEKLAKVLEGFDRNLIFDISGVTKNNFIDLFRKAPVGLKVDISYFDKKKAYMDIINKTKQEQLLKEVTLDGLKRKDFTLLNQLSKNIGVGKYYRPKIENETQYVETLTNMIKQGIIEMPNRLLEAKNVTIEKDGTFSAWHDALLKKGENGRFPWAWYKGIEY